jgi:DNA-binding transcriptional LysR family regulator
MPRDACMTLSLTWPHLPWEPVVKVWLHSGPQPRLPRWGPHSTGDASPGAALFLPQIQPVFSVVAPLFVNDAAGDFHTLVNRFFAGDGLPGPRLQATGSVEGVKGGVASDPRAVGILPSYALAEELRAGRIVRLDIRPTPPQMRLEALLSLSRARHPSTGELVDGVRRAFSADARPRDVEPRRRFARTGDPAMSTLQVVWH